MSENTPQYARRQILGKRTGLEPYYHIAEQTDQKLVLQSHLHANRKAGRTFMAVGGALLILSVSLYCLSFLGSQGDLAPLLGGMVCAVPFGIVGGLGLIGGISLARTVNTITIDRASRTITFMQQSRRARRQTLRFDQVVRLCMRSVPFNTSFFLQRYRQIAALFFVTDETFSWLIDSAADSQALAATASAISDMVGLPVEDELSTGEHAASGSPVSGAG